MDLINREEGERFAGCQPDNPIKTRGSKGFSVVGRHFERVLRIDRCYLRGTEGDDYFLTISLLVSRSPTFTFLPSFLPSFLPPSYVTTDKIEMVGSGEYCCNPLHTKLGANWAQRTVTREVNSAETKCVFGPSPVSDQGHRRLFM